MYAGRMLHVLGRDTTQHYPRYRGGHFLSSYDATCEKCGHWLMEDTSGVIYCAHCGNDHRVKINGAS